MGKNILDLGNEEAKKFFLTEERYFTFDLPNYFTFNEILEEISKKLDNRKLSEFYSDYKITNHEGIEETKKNNPSFFENVNYKLFNNKNGEYSWRLFQLIHPVLYVSLVNEITKEENWNIILEKFKEKGIIECVSIPVIKSEKKKTEKGEQILTWWEDVEQKSISLALEYSYIFHTDIVDCYGSIYTHSISWALHTRDIAKQNRNDKKLIGNIIDKHLQDMANG
ncbi:MAG: reverse transcriptase, partial [Candidatus Gracilibacteria bacterium]|nr:reverse transcriptase [Candidatus Gracilibacteria bacterium]